MRYAADGFPQINVPLELSKTGKVLLPCAFVFLRKSSL
jgi:hypothetical protein